MHISIRGKKKRIYLSFRYRKQLHRLPTQYICECKNQTGKCKYCKLALALSYEIERKIKEDTLDLSVYFPTSKIKNYRKKLEDMPFSDYFNQWLAYKEKTVTLRTYQNYKSVSQHLLNHFKDTKISEIKTYDIKQFFLNCSLKGNYQSLLKSIITDIFNTAVSDEILTKSPVQKIKTKKIEKKELEILSIADIKRILTYMEEHHANAVVFFAIAFYTGLRHGEILALQWQDVDLVKHKIHVYKAVSLGKLKDTKTGSDRLIDIIPSLDRYLQRGNDSDYVVSVRMLKSIGRFQTAWEQTLAALNMPYVRPYATRHSFACMMLEAGEHPKWIATMLGHTDLTMLFKVYGNHMRQPDTRAGIIFENFCQNDTKKNNE